MTINDLKIALVSLQQDVEKSAPIGLVYLATYLKERLDINPQNIKIIDRTFDVEKTLKQFSPSIIGFSSMTVDYGRVVRFAKKIKAEYNIPFVIGGVHISSLPQSLDHVFNLGVIGEGEETFKEVISVLIKKRKFEVEDLKKINGLVFFDKGNIVTTPRRTPIVDIDTLPFPDFKFLNKEYFKEQEITSIGKVGRKVQLISARGCPFKCVFCSTSRFWGGFRLHSADYTARMIKNVIDEFNIDTVNFMDDLFAFNITRVKELKEAFTKYGILDKIKAIECNQRTSLMSDDLCKAMKDINIVTLNFGFESGSEKMLGYLKRDTTTVDMNKKAIQLCKKYGINAYGSLIYGSPGETIEDMKKTNEFIKFAIDNGARYVWSFVATPFPDTPFWDIALQRGKVKMNMEWDLLGMHQLDNPLLLDENIDKKEFKEVFLEGQKELRKLRIKLIRNFLIKSPFAAIRLVMGDPKYYFSRFFKKVFKY